MSASSCHVVVFSARLAGAAMEGRWCRQPGSTAARHPAESRVLEGLAAVAFRKPFRKKGGDGAAGDHSNTG